MYGAIAFSSIKASPVNQVLEFFNFDGGVRHTQFDRVVGYSPQRLRSVVFSGFLLVTGELTGEIEPGNRGTKSNRGTGEISPRIHISAGGIS